jgi:hypothetical protein
VAGMGTAATSLHAPFVVASMLMKFATFVLLSQERATIEVDVADAATLLGADAGRWPPTPTVNHR